MPEMCLTAQPFFSLFHVEHP